MTDQSGRDLASVVSELQRLLRDAGGAGQNPAVFARQVLQAVHKAQRSIDAALAALESTVQRMAVEAGAAIPDEQPESGALVFEDSGGAPVPRISVTMPRALTTFLERDPPPELRDVFATKIARPKGPGFSDTLHMDLAQARAMLLHLHANRLPSQQYQNINRAVVSIQKAYMDAVSAIEPAARPRKR